MCLFLVGMIDVILWRMAGTVCWVSQGYCQRIILLVDDLPLHSYLTYYKGVETFDKQDDPVWKKIEE
jgi:hypothetical protein